MRVYRAADEATRRLHHGAVGPQRRVYCRPSMRSSAITPRYRFSGHTLSPARRTLVREGRELPLIPRCFDLLVLLIERRNEALTRREILDTVWSDVVVTDGALSQAVRILRRTLGDDPREPTFIRTVQRHGYRFVCDDVVEEPDEGPPEPVRDTTAELDASASFDQAIETLIDDDSDDAEEADVRRRQAAETLHQLGTAEALDRLNRSKGHAAARAYLRETRWDVPGAGPVPLFGHPGWLAAARILFLLRIRRVARLAGRRWMAAAAGGAAAGAIAGFVGGFVLRFGPGSTAGDGVLAMLPLLGTAIGGVAAAGVGAGLAAAEAAFRAQRRLALAVAGASSGLAVGATAHILGRLVLEGLFGRDLAPLAGAVEGLVLGGAVGLGYGLATPIADGGMATPHGIARVRVALLTGLACALAAGMLGWSGRFLGAMSLDFMAQSFPGSQVGLAPLARLLGEQEPGVVTRVAISVFEGLMFGSGLAAGLTRRPS